MWQHSRSTCIWSIDLSDYSIFHSRARGSDQDFLAAYEEATEPRVPIGQVEVITSEVYVHHLSWLTFTKYLCHK